MKFIHAADIHIDSPLRGLETLPGAPAAKIREATRRAFENLVELAIDESVQFVIIAGDLFDGKWPDASTGHWAAHEFRRLDECGIRVYLLRGNHDAEVRNLVSWPANVREFPTDQAATLIDEPTGVALHGRGFAQREVCDDLAAAYPQAVPGRFNIGLLHTSLTGDPLHDTYAPTTEQNLLRLDYDYWALGHIHSRRVIRERPYIAYSGNTQGRHAKETGAKGCLLATVDDQQLTRVQFRAVDTVRWSLLSVELDEADDLPRLYQRLQSGLQLTQSADEGRLSAVRVIVQGACHAHGDLASIAGRSEVEAEMRNLAAAAGDVWLEKILFQTAPRVDRKRLRQAKDLLGELLREIDKLEQDDDALLELVRCLTPLADKAPRELRQAGVEWEEPDQVRRWLKQAESLLVSRLWEAEV